jgi:hypothetical protein
MDDKTLFVHLLVISVLYKDMLNIKNIFYQPDNKHELT